MRKKEQIIDYKISYPNYQKSTINMMASILKHYNYDSGYSTLKNLDEKLQDADNICLIILDGLGNNNLKYASKNGFFETNKLDVISSVFPSTTVAAITTIQSGVSPISHGMLGWTLRFDEVNKNIDVFRNKYTYFQENVEIDYMSIMKYKNIFTKIKENSNTKCFYYRPESIKNDLIDGINICYKDIRDGLKKLRNNLKSNANSFTYFYCDYPDNIMHKKGTRSLAVKLKIRSLQRLIKRYTKGITNTTFIISADHGLINIEKSIDLYTDKKYAKMLSHHVSLESRATVLYVKNKYLDEFKETFTKDYGNDFILLTKEEALKEKIFGDGDKHFKVDSFLGDYIAIAKKGVCISKHTNVKKMKASHAGMTEDEMIVPLIFIKNE